MRNPSTKRSPTKDLSTKKAYTTEKSMTNSSTKETTPAATENTSTIRVLTTGKTTASTPMRDTSTSKAYTVRKSTRDLPTKKVLQPRQKIPQLPNFLQQLQYNKKINERFSHKKLL